MHKAELVWCRLKIDVSGLVTSHEGDMFFSINIEVNGEKQTAFQKTLISQGYTYKYILKLQKSQEKMLDIKRIHQNLVECVKEILKLYNNLERF